MWHMWHVSVYNIHTDTMIHHIYIYTYIHIIWLYNKYIYIHIYFAIIGNYLMYWYCMIPFIIILYSILYIHILFVDSWHCIAVDHSMCVDNIWMCLLFNAFSSRNSKNQKGEKIICVSGLDLSNSVSSSSSRWGLGSLVFALASRWNGVETGCTMDYLWSTLERISTLWPGCPTRCFGLAVPSAWMWVQIVRTLWKLQVKSPKSI